MRIVCEKCSAAYAIDDKFVTAKGVRAQCPRCRHLQLVKKDDFPQPSAKGKGKPAMSPPKPPPPPLPSSSDAAPDAAPFLFDLEGLPPPPPGPGIEISSPSNPPVEVDFSDMVDSPPTRADRPSVPPLAVQARAQPPPPMAPAPRPSAPTEPAQSVESSGPFGAPNQNLGDPALECRSCGRALDDPFDQALGICDQCRTRAKSAVPQFEAPPPAPAPAPSQPLGRMSAAPEPMASAPAPLEVARPSRERGRVPRTTADYQDDEVESPSSRNFAVGVVALAALIGGATFLAIKKPWLKKAPPTVAKTSAASDKVIDALLNQWRVRFPKLEGSAAEHLAAGEEALAKDTPAGYQEAEDEFQKALLLDRKSDRAVAGWVMALAFRSGPVDENAAKVAEQLLGLAAQRGDARVFVASAHLMLARGGNANDVRVMAERGKSSPSAKDKALAYLAIGQSFLEKNPQFAADAFGEALKLDPKLKRAYVYQSKLLISRGDYRAAIKAVEQRLELDADQWDASDTLAHLYLEVGEVEKAHRAYERARVVSSNGFRARFSLAVLAYQHEGRLTEASLAFDALAETDKLAVRDLIEVLAHRATVQRLTQNYDAAAGTVRQALELKADDPAVRVQAFLLSLEQGKLANAREHFNGFKGKLADPALELALEGKLLFFENKNTEALKLLLGAVEKDPRRTDALLLAGAAAARAKLESKAYELALKRGMKAEPAQAGPVEVMARVYVRPADVLRGARGEYTRLAHDAEDPNPPSCEGLLAWHSGDLNGADAQFARVAQIDPSNGNAFAFRSLIELRRRHIAEATKLAARAVESERMSGVAHLAQGLAFLAANKLDLAKKSLRTASELEPQLLWAKTKLGEIEIKQQDVESGRRLLTSVLLNDPQYTEARRSLYGATP